MRRTAALAALFLTLASGGRPALSAPTLWVPARPDSAPAESEPAPFLIPGQTPSDTTVPSAALQARAEFARAEQFERAHHPGAAVVSYQKALHLDPTIPEAGYRVGLLYKSRGQWKEAVNGFAMELEHHPDHLDAARELGLALGRAGDYPRAIQQLELLSKRRPDDGRIWHALGFVYSEAGRKADAERALRRTIALPPEDAEEHRDLGAVLAAQGKTREARAEYARSLTIAPREPITWLDLGNLERGAGRTDSALIAYRRALALDSSFVLARMAEIQVLREAGRDAEVIAAYRRWLALSPTDHAVRLDAVDFMLRHGDPDEAVALAAEGPKVAPRAGAPQVVYAMALAGRGRLREAVPHFRTAQELFDGNAEEIQRVETMVAALRAHAPDSLHTFFHADSVQAARRQASRDSAAAQGKRKRGP